MRLARIYHAGRDPQHRLRDTAMAAAGVDVTLFAPSAWPGNEGADVLGDAHPNVSVVHVPVRREGDVNRHTFLDPSELTRLHQERPFDLIDVHEEPFSAVTHQLLASLHPSVPAVGYTAQNLDKRFPPPFAQWERRAFGRLWGIHSCSRQAASVVAGKGYGGQLTVLPLGTDDARLRPGAQRLDAAELRLGLVGRLVPEKGVLAAVQVLAGVHRCRPAVLSLVGDGPELGPAMRLAETLGVADRVAHVSWTDGDGLAAVYRQLHWVLLPSMATATWVEQFGRVVTEGQACGAVVASYSSGSLPEVVADTGLLVPEGDTSAMAAGIVAACRDGRWARWRKAGLERAPDYVWSAVAIRQVQFYETVIAAGPPPRPTRGARAHAVRVWGEPARALGSARPFALPILRDNGVPGRVLERLIDAVVRP